jgi:hypothetical protein
MLLVATEAVVLYTVMEPASILPTAPFQATQQIMGEQYLMASGD